MKKNYSVNTTNSRNYFGTPSRLSSLLLPLLLVAFCLFGVNESAFAAWSGSGQGTLKNGVWYVVYEDGEESLTKGNTKDYNLSGPGASLSFQAKRERVGTGNLLVTQNSGTTNLYNGNPGKVTGYSWGVEVVDYENYNPSVDVNSTKITFKNNADIKTNTKKYFRYVHVTMAQYLENPSPATTSSSCLSCGTADINSDPTSGLVTVQWCNVPAMTYKIENDANNLFSVSVANNSEAGKYNTATFTVSYKHTIAGTHTATLKITDTFGNYSKTIYLTGTTNKLQPEVTWSPNDETFNVDDVLTATNSNGLTVTLSGNSTYVGCQNNTATMLAATSGKITVTAHVAGNDIYADRDIAKEITITNLEKQHISWNQDFSHLKTTDGTKSITLNATSDSGLPVIYELVGDMTGLSLTQSGSVWTLTYSATECKNTTIVAKQGGNATYAPASSVSKTIKVIDPTKVCDTNETLVNSTVTLKSQSTTYNIDILSTMTIQVSRTKTGLFDIYLNGFKVEIYSGRNGTGDKLHEYSYEAGDINNSKTISLSNLNIAAKSVKLISEASNGYNVTSVTYTKQKKCTISPASLSFETYPNTKTSAKTFDVTYANYPISLECSNPKFEFSPAEFGDCDAYGTQTVSVTYTAGANEGEDVGYLYIKDNTGITLKTCTLNVTISKVAQSVTSTNIQSSYNTTDRIELSAEANSGLTNFVYTASPEGVASFDGNVMTFSQSGTIAITATQPGSNVYAAASTTVNGVQVNTVTPTIATNPSVSEIKYLDNLTNDEGKQLSGGLATVTLRGEANTEVEGTFTWTNLGQITDKPGSHDYYVTFKPKNDGMYNSKTFTKSVTISRADGAIEMNNGEVKVKVADINDDLDECKIDLDGLVASKIEDAIEASRAGAVSFKVISANSTKASIDGNNFFSATEVGAYTIRAKQAQTDYYKADSVEFTVTVNKLTPTIVFDNTDNPEYIYSGDVIETPAYRKYNGKFVDRVVNYVSSDPSVTGAIHVDGTTLTARDVTAPEGSAVQVTITASTLDDALYNAASETATHNYAVRAKRSPVFTMDTYVNTDASKTLNIGEQAIITYDENTNEFLTVGTSSEHSYISYSHDTENRRITVTAVKGTITGDGVQQIIVNQPGNARLFDRSITYTFTVKKNVSALSLAGLTTSMEVEDTVATPYTGLANTEAAVQFSCSPEGSMKMENGKLIALQAGTNTVTFSQPATEYWTGISQSKTITVSRKNPNMTTELDDRHAWYSIIEHPFKSLNTEKELQITSSNESLAKYIKEEDKIYVYGTSGNVTFTVNQDANYKYNAVVNYQKTFEIFQPNNRLPMTLTSENLNDYKGGGAGSISWNDGGVLCGGASGIGIGGAGWDYSAKYIILSFVGIPDVLSFDFKNANWSATQYGWHFYQSSNGSDWILLKEYADLLMNATGGTSEGSESLKLNPDTRYVKLEYHGNFGGRFKNVSITERKEIAPKAETTDFGLGYNGNDPTTRTIKVDWYNVKPCTVTITGADADKFILAEGSTTINSLLDNFGTAELTVSYKHETNSTTSHTANLHIQDVDGNYADIALIGQTTPAPQDIVWRNDLTPMPLNGVFPNAAMVGSNQPLTLVSDDETIVRVDENNTLVGVAAGTTRVTATAEGSTKWAETSSYIDIEVTTKNVQFITWNDNLSNRKRQDGQTVNITLTATSSVGLPITYELDEAAQTFASISGNVLTLTDWGSGQVIAHQVGNEDYVAVQAVKSLVSRNPSAGCRPLVGEYKSEYTIWTLGEKEIELDGKEPATIEFDAKCDASALWGLHVGEYYDGFYHEVAEISRLQGNNLTSSYKHFGPFELHRNTTKVRIYTETGATMNRTFKNVEVTLAKYLELEDNQLHFEQVDKGSTKTQSFYINYSNISGVLDVEMENKTNTQFEVLTETVGEDCGDVAKNKQIQIRFTGSTLGTEENAILVHNNDQSLRIPVSATVVLPSQTITWEPELNIRTTDLVTLSATATSELPVSFTSGNTDIAEVVCEAGVYSLDIKSYGEVAITAHQPGDNVNWGAATDKTLTFHISRVVPKVEKWPTAQITLPNTLAAATLTGGEAPDGIPGSFRWEDDSQTVTRESHTFNVVFEPTNTNYYEPVSHPLELEILKTPQTITWNRADESEEGCSDVVILDATASSGLPITYHSSDSTKAYAVKDEVNNVMKLYILKGGDVTITAVQPGDETYAAAPSIAKTITLIRVLPTIETLPTATDMYVHHFLSNSTPEGGVVKAGENTVTGVFNWQDGSEVMDVPGTNQRTVVFQPYNSDYYQPASAVIDVEVKRFAPKITSTITTEPAVYGTPMSDIVYQGSVTAIDGTDPARPKITGTWTWKLDPNAVLGVDDKVTYMIFHPTQTQWYDDVEFPVNVTITEYTDFTPTATAEIVYGQTLSEAKFVSTTHNPLDNSEILTGNFKLGIGLNPNACYAEGDHTITIAFQVTTANFSHAWKEGTATLTVLPGLIYNGTDGVWNTASNWIGGVPDPNGESRVTINENVNVISDVEVLSLTISAGKTVTIKNGATLTVGANNSFNRETYGNIHVEEGGKLILTSGRVGVNNLYLDASLGNRSLNISANSGQIRNPELIDVNGDAYFDLVLDPVKCSYGWYDFTVPFPVDNRTGISRFQNGAWNTSLRTEQQYAIMTYHEEIRANGDYGWKKYYGIMQPGKCYTITVDNTAPLYRFRKIAGESITTPSSVALTATDGKGGDVHKGWNSIGNGTLTHTHVSSQYVTKVQVYDHATNSYSVLDNFGTVDLPVGTALFVQTSQASNMLFTDVNTIVAEAPMRTQGRTLDEYLLAFGLENDAVNVDRLYLSASEDAENVYEIGHDLSKFEVSTKVAQIWADAYGQKLCDVEAPLVADQAIIPISLYAAQTGTYTLDVVRGPQDASLYLMYNGAVIWNLSQSAYTFDLTRGTNSAYSLLLTAEAPAISTGSDAISGEKTQQVEKILLNGQLYILRDGQMYDATGKKVK